jgi:hypothetical protein
MTHLTAPFNVGNTTFILVCASLVMLMRLAWRSFMAVLSGERTF